ncbi:MAG: hypothetical protein JST22_09795 [Bacteroidetes bacterium]|nr:hypothetical protein [Bacteroidota bacterium]
MADYESERMLADLHEHVRTRCYGKYRGVVTDVDDSETMGRIRAKVPEVYGPDQDSPWALPASGFAGPSHGFVMIPEVNDGVWIEFEAGDISRPIWTGGWWGSGELPDGAGTKKRAIVTTAGHRFVLNDDDKEIQLLHSGGAELKMTDDDIKLTKGNAETTMTGDQITLKLGSSEITITQTDITLKAGSGQIKISASGVDVNNGALTVR